MVKVNSKCTHGWLEIKNLGTHYEKICHYCGENLGEYPDPRNISIKQRVLLTLNKQRFLQPDERAFVWDCMNKKSMKKPEHDRLDEIYERVNYGQGIQGQGQSR